MKKIIVTFIFAFILNIQTAHAYYDMSITVEGSSIANNELQFEVVKKLYKTLAPAKPTCSDYRISTTQLLHYPYDVKKNKRGNYVKGYWKELWTVNACGNSIQLPVTFYIKRSGTQFEIDRFLLNK